MKPEPDTRTRLPPELGPEVGVKENKLTEANTDSDREESEPQGTEPHTNATETSPGAEKDGASHAATDPDTTWASVGENEPNEHGTEASERNREPIIQTTDGAPLAATKPGWSPVSATGERYSNEAESGVDRSSEVDIDKTPNPTAEDPTRKEQVTRPPSGDTIIASPTLTIAVEIIEQDEAHPSSKP